MTSRPQQYSRALRYTANALSTSRIVAAPLFFEKIIKRRTPSWKVTAGIGALALTDKADGMVGRKSNRLAGIARDENGAWLDQMADKALVHGVMGALSINEARNGNYLLAGAYAANQAIVLARDVIVTRVRKRAAKEHKPTASKRLGQIKTTVQDITMAWATSPLSKLRVADKPVGEVISVAGFTISSALSVASGMQLAKGIEHTQPLPEPFITGPNEMPTIALSIPQQRNMSQE